MSTVVFGPSGGIGGQPFDDEPPDEGASVREIRVWSGSTLDAIQLVLDIGGEAVERTKHGGNAGNLSIMKLDETEFITEVYGRYSGYIESLSIRTNLGKNRRFGALAGVMDFLYVAPPGFHIIGFWGRSSRVIDSIGVHLVPVSSS